MLENEILQRLAKRIATLELTLQNAEGEEKSKAEDEVLMITNQLMAEPNGLLYLDLVDGLVQSLLNNIN